MLEGTYIHIYFFHIYFTLTLFRVYKLNFNLPFLSQSIYLVFTIDFFVLSLIDSFFLHLLTLYMVLSEYCSFLRNLIVSGVGMCEHTEDLYSTNNRSREFNLKMLKYETYLVDICTHMYTCLCAYKCHHFGMVMVNMECIWIHNFYPYILVGIDICKKEKNWMNRE